jgi:hypothetical protein
MCFGNTSANKLSNAYRAARGLGAEQKTRLLICAAAESSVRGWCVEGRVTEQVVIERTPAEEASV